MRYVRQAVISQVIAAAKYEILVGDWCSELRQGFAECFRISRRHGVSIFKWHEIQVKRNEMLEL